MERRKDKKMKHCFKSFQSSGLLFKLLCAFLLTFSVIGCSSKPSTDPQACTVDASLPASSMDLSDDPVYDGNLSETIHQNQPFAYPKELCAAGTIYNSPLDSLGRAGQAWAYLDTECLSDEERSDISSIKPAGFINHAYDWIDGGTVYNRSHLIAHMLGGADESDNLMTGTRSFNAFGMLPYESQIRDYLEDHSGVVFYRVTPVYQGDDLVAKGAVMEAQSMEDDGAGLQFCVFVYNVQPGIAIDYATGENRPENENDQPITIAPENSNATEPVVDSQEAASESSLAGSDEGQKEEFIVNLSSKKFHRPDCEGVKKMKEKNKKEVLATRKELIEQGYSPCGMCLARQ